MELTTLDLQLDTYLHSDMLTTALCGPVSRSFEQAISVKSFRTFTVAVL